MRSEWVGFFCRRFVLCLFCFETLDRSHQKPLQSYTVALFYLALHKFQQWVKNSTSRSPLVFYGVIVRTVASGLPLLCHFHFLCRPLLLMIPIAFYSHFRSEKVLLREPLRRVILNVDKRKDIGFADSVKWIELFVGWKHLGISEDVPPKFSLQINLIHWMSVQWEGSWKLDLVLILVQDLTD